MTSTNFAFYECCAEPHWPLGSMTVTFPDGYKANVVSLAAARIACAFSKKGLSSGAALAAADQYALNALAA